jgi:tetratricopeptide (TPR) repeat protein
VLEQVKEDKNLTANESLATYVSPNMATFETEESAAKASPTPPVTSSSTPTFFSPPAGMDNGINQYDNLDEYNAHSDNVYAKIVNEKPDMAIPPNQDMGFVKMLQLQELYEVRGNSNPVLLKDYAQLLKKYHQPCNSIVNAYLATQQEHLKQSDNRQFVFDFAINAENNAIDYFMQDIAYYKKAFGSEVVNKRVYDAVYNSVLMAINDRDYGLFDKAEAILQGANLPDIDTKLFTIRAIFYQGIEDWDNYVAVTSQYINQQQLSDPQLLTDVASVYQMYVRNKKALRQALKWTQKAIDIESGYGNNYLLSALHYQMANYADALDCIETAIDIADYQDIVYTEGLRLRDKILVQLDKQ